MIFRLNSCFAELVSAKTFGGQLKLELAAFFFQVEDAIAAVMKDPILPGAGNVAAHVEEHRGGAGQSGLGADEMGSHGLCLIDEHNISHQLSQWEVLCAPSELSQVRSSSVRLLLRLDDPTR